MKIDRLIGILSILLQEGCEKRPCSGKTVRNAG